MKQVLIGVDGGGSKTEYLLADLDGTVKKNLIGLPVSVTADSLGQAAYNLRDGLRQLLSDEKDVTIAVLTLAVAGLDTKRDLQDARLAFTDILHEWKIEHLTVVNDGVAVLASATKKRPAIVVVGGTGANCLGFGENGQTVRVSGLDYLLADEGSGYDAGRLAIKAVVRSLDGRGQSTQLEKTILEHFGVKSVGALKDVVYAPTLNKEEVASFAQLCVDAKNHGDQVAGGIITYCLNQLTLNVRAVAQKLDCEKREFYLVPAGGFLLALLDDFQQQLREAGLSWRLTKPTQSPAYGALKIAQQIQAGKEERHFQVLVP